MALTPNYRSSLQNVTSDTAFFFLLTITTPDEVIRVVNNWENIQSRGEIFYAYPFSLSLPTETGDRQPVVDLTIDNVDQRLTESIRKFATAPSVKIELVSTIDFDIPEKTIDFLKVSNVEYDVMQIRFTLQPDNMLARKFPIATYNSVEFPDLYF